MDKMAEGREKSDEKTGFIFVYGTLMKGFQNHELYLAERVLERSAGYMKGELYHLKYGYPAVIDGTGEVKGEIYLVKDIEKLLPVLDYLEDYNQPGQEDLYKREMREVRDDKGNIKKCYVYIWSPNRLPELKEVGRHIGHGDWAKFMEENSNITE